MPKNKIEDLRNHLFDTIERLLDPDDPMDLDRAETVGKVAQVVVNSAKVEVDFIKHTGHGGSSFIQSAAPAERQIGPAVNVHQITAPAEFVPEEKLCTQCTLPDCNDKSPQCLVLIQRNRFKEAA